jgi:hypothetical protein
MRHRIMVKLNDKEYKQIRDLAMAFKLGEQEVFKSMMASAHDSLMTALKSMRNKGETSVKNTLEKDGFDVAVPQDVEQAQKRDEFTLDEPIAIEGPK